MAGAGAGAIAEHHHDEHVRDREDARRAGVTRDEQATAVHRDASQDATVAHDPADGERTAIRHPADNERTMAHDPAEGQR